MLSEGFDAIEFLARLTERENGAVAGTGTCRCVIRQMPPCSFRGGRSHGLNTSKKFIGAGRIQHTYTYAFFVHAFAFGIGPHPQLRTLGLSLELRLPFHLENIHMHMGLDPIDIALR